MLRFLVIVVLLAVLSLGAAFAVRARWISEKIATLNSPASTAYAQANAILPKKGERPRIVIIGDSRIERWPASAWPDTWEVINRGIGGETAAQLELRFDDDAVALDPDVIVIETGINDLVAASYLGEGAIPFADKTAKTLRRLVEDAVNSGHRTLVATIIPPARPEFLRLLVWNESVRDLVQQANADLAQFEFPEQAGVIDLSAQLVEGDRTMVADKYRLDTLHFNDAGYERLTTALIRRVQSMLEAKRP